MTTPLTALHAWRQLTQHHAEIATTPLTTLVGDAPRRFEQCSAQAAGLFLDYSKNHLTPTTIQHLVELAHARELPAWIERMFAGDTVNTTENRAAWHVALRRQEHAPPEVQATIANMQRFAERVRQTGITDVLNLGLGGSDLGPKLVCEALWPQCDDQRIRPHFLSNVDGDHLDFVLSQLNPATTLVIVASKSFTTQETLLNARVVRDWLGAAAADNLVAVTAQPERAHDFGVPATQVFPMWDWVGGRYSVWSAIGLPIILSCGTDVFDQLLKGAHALDEHFRTAPLAQNLPVLLALIGVWYRNFWGLNSHAVFPYAESLASLPLYLQQLEMESNGKRVQRNGVPVDSATAPIIWGDRGTNAQHAFMQLLHQSDHVVSVDFVLPIHAYGEHAAHQQAKIANCLAQSETLLKGWQTAELNAAGVDKTLIPHKEFVGGKPSTTILFDRLDAYHLGALLALYEHKVFVQSVIWGINAFDQWGVERGKQLAAQIVDELSPAHPLGEHDASTQGLLTRIRQAQ